MPGSIMLSVLEQTSFWPQKALEWAQLAGACVTAIAALIALGIVSFKTLESQWNESFRKLYDEFWQDENIAEARILLAYDEKYDSIKLVLESMASTSRIIGDRTSIIKVKDKFVWSSGKLPDIDKEKYIYTDDEIKSTEQIDRFCSKCLQMIFTTNMPIFKNRQRKFKTLFFHFWVDTVELRPELKLYIQKFWPTLYNQIIAQKSYLPLLSRLLRRLRNLKPEKIQMQEQEQEQPSLTQNS